jgi:hypothetical protein
MSESELRSGSRNHGSKEPGRRSAGGWFIIMVFALSLLLFYFTSSCVIEMRTEKMENELDVTPVSELDEQRIVKLHGTIDCDYDTVITGTRDENGWDGCAHEFFLNDSGDRIPIKYHGSYGHPQIEVHESPHQNGKKELYLNGDTVYLLGEFRSEENGDFVYLEEIAVAEDHFYGPREEFILVFLFTVIGCMFMGLVIVVSVLNRSGYYGRDPFKWESNARFQMEVAKYTSSMCFVSALVFIIYYIYSTESLFLLPATVCLIILILSIYIYAKYKKAMPFEDHHFRWLERFAPGHDGAVARLRRLLEDNGFQYTSSRGKTRVMELPEHGLKLKILTADPETDDGLFIGVKLGPVTPFNEEPVVRRLKSLIDKEFC